MRRWNKSVWILVSGFVIGLGASSPGFAAAPAPGSSAGPSAAPSAAASRAPTSGQAAINETLAYIDANKPEEALASARKAIQIDPDRVEAHLLYIRLMTDLNRRSQVQAEYAKRRDQKKDGLSLLLYGRTLESVDQMESTFRKALELDPKLGWAYYCIATVQVERKQVDKAIASLEQAIRIQPNFTQAMNSLGLLYVSQGKLEPAIATYEKVVALNPSDAQALYQLGSLLGKKGDVPRAVTNLEKAAKLAPENPQVMSNLAFMYFKQKKYDESIALYDKVLKVEPEYGSAKLNREVVKRVRKGDIKFEAVTLMEQAMEASDPTTAISRYRRVIETSPNFELPYLALAQLLAATNKIPEAEKAFLRAVELNPGFVEGERMLAEFYLVSRQAAKAEPFLIKAINLSPKEPELYAALGAVYAGMDQPGKAELAFGKAAALLPGLLAMPSRLNKARAMEAQSKFADAAAELRSMLKVAPNYLEAHLELGTCYFAMEDFDQAREQFKIVLKSAPDNKDVKALIKQVDDKQAEFKAKAKDQMRARQIVVKTQAEADGILKQVKSGANFEALARAKSIGPEAANGGDVGFFKKGELMPEFENAVIALKPGEVSNVVKTARGYHIIKRVN